MSHVSQRTIELFARFIEKGTGLLFPEGRLHDLERQMVAASRKLGYRDPEACLLSLMSEPLSQEQLEILAPFLTIGETYFLRDHQSYRVLEEQLLPPLVAARRKEERTLRIWSAGCSSGEEAYSLAILLSRAIPDLSEWRITLCGTDINPAALEKAREGVYGKWSFRNTPPWLADYFSARPDGRFEVVPRIRKMVRFTHLNLAQDSYDSLFPDGSVDIVFCRNVLLYFGEEEKQKVVAGFHRTLAAGGWLFVSPTEVDHRLLSAFTCRRFHGAFAFAKRSGGGEEGLTSFPEPPPDVVPTFSGAARPAPPVAPRATGHRAGGGSPAALGAAVRPLTVREPAVQEGRDTLEEKGEAPLPEPALDRSYREAAELYAQGRYDLAAGKAQAVLAADTGHPDALELLARSYGNLGRFAEAAGFCESAIAADRLRPHNHYLLAVIQAEQGQVDEALKSLKKALYLDQDFLPAYVLLGNLERQAGRIRDSERHFATALRLLERRDSNEVLPDLEGMTAGRLTEMLRLALKGRVTHG